MNPPLIIKLSARKHPKYSVYSNVFVIYRTKHPNSILFLTFKSPSPHFTQHHQHWIINRCSSNWNRSQWIKKQYPHILKFSAVVPKRYWLQKLRLLLPKVIELKKNMKLYLKNLNRKNPIRKFNLG